MALRIVNLNVAMCKSILISGNIFEVAKIVKRFTSNLLKFKNLHIIVISISLNASLFSWLIIQRYIESTFKATFSVVFT